MECPDCRSQSDTVMDSRKTKLDGIPSIRRRRKCNDCGHAFTTYEIVGKDAAQIERQVIADTIRKITTLIG